ncbi:MAG: hypothetical protein R8K48_00900 [Gallionella sp.]
MQTSTAVTNLYLNHTLLLRSRSAYLRSSGMEGGKRKPFDTLLISAEVRQGFLIITQLN